MTAPINTGQSFVTQLKEQIEYPHSGVFSKVLVKDAVCQSSLFCLAANTEISEHTSTHNATISVVEGMGLLSLGGENIQLEAGVFIFMPANAPHALKAESNLAFLLTLSEKATERN